MDGILTLESRTIQYWRVRLSNTERLVLGLGDSLTAGAGLSSQSDTVTARLADLVAATWVVRARAGLTARGVAALLDREVVVRDLAAADVVVVSVGVNDLLRLRTLRRWRRDLDELLARVVETTPGRVVLLGMPPVGSFPRLPRPLAVVLGRLAARMDRVGIDVAAHRGALHVPLPAGLVDRREAFGDDGFHPSALAHDHLARLVAATLERPPGGRTRGDADAVR